MTISRIALLFNILALPFSAGAASLADEFMPGTSYYFNNFDPGLGPWKPGQHLNIEEVFKNYRYYEIVLNKNGKELTVNQYIQGIKSASEMYIELPDGSLQKK